MKLYKKIVHDSIDDTKRSRGNAISTKHCRNEITIGSATENFGPK